MPDLPTPPATRRTEDAVDQFGVLVPDPYRWLEDADSPEVRAWMEAQDTAARAHLQHCPRRAPLADRFRRLFYYDAVSPPLVRGGRLFYVRKHSDREKAVIYWREGDGDERVLLDPNAMSDDGSISVGVWVPSHDGRRVAYTVTENNADASTLYVRDVDSGADLDDVIEGARYAHPSWLPDGTGFYYTGLPTGGDIPAAEMPAHAEVRFHTLGRPPADDRVVHPADGSAETFLHGEVTHDGAWVIVHIAHGWRSTDVHVAPRTGEPEQLTPLITGRDATFEVTAWNDRFYVLTNEDAPRYRVMTFTPEQRQRDAWRELVPESDATLESAHIGAGHLILSYLRDAHAELELRDLDGHDPRRVELPGLGSVGSVLGDPDAAELFFSFTSFTEPTRVYRLDPTDLQPDLWARVRIDADTSDLVSDQVRYRSKDGTEVTMFVLRRRDVDADGQRPTILYGYGGFNLSLTPSFSPSILPWLEAGGIYAIPNLRGGGEYGEDWHRAGMLENRQNVFDDFLAAADHLVKSGWTRPGRLAIRGGSNGGLLVGAAMTQRPELFRAVICAVPLLDMLRYHLFGSGKTWMPEYGNPDDERMFHVLRAYSPYHHVEDGTAYPAMLMLGADSDDRVDPMHARKFTAAIQNATTSEHPVLLRIEENAGHTGADMVTRMVDQQADVYAFLMDQLAVE